MGNINRKIVNFNNLTLVQVEPDEMEINYVEATGQVIINEKWTGESKIIHVDAYPVALWFDEKRCRYMVDCDDGHMYY